MTLDKFGRHSDNSSNSLNSSNIHIPVLPYTKNGDIDAKNLKISNLKLPTNQNDAANKEYVDNFIKFCDKNFVNRILYQSILHSFNNIIKEIKEIKDDISVLKENVLRSKKL